MQLFQPFVIALTFAIPNVASLSQCVFFSPRVSVSRHLVLNRLRKVDLCLLKINMINVGGYFYALAKGSYEFHLVGVH
jgi:hypothetical protein